MITEHDLEALRTRWLAERPKYDALCAEVTSVLQAATQGRGINCDICSRTKEVDSLLKKVLTKNYLDPYNDIRDKAGVRIICTYRDSVTQLAEMFSELFEVLNREDKAAELQFDELGYPGIHFDIKLQMKCLGRNNELAGLICEIQLLTRAQSLWADISHELAYKPAQSPPYEVKRAIYLQSALVEIFDSQMTEARKVMIDLPGGREMRVLDELDRHFFRFTAAKYNRELSLMILDGLLAMFSEEDIDGFAHMVDSFVECNWDLLDQIFAQYANDDRRSPLLFQPESILIFLCMERNIFELKHTWGQFMPLDLLEGLAEVWGADDFGRVS